MRTTLLNPTVWLLAGTALAGLMGMVRKRHTPQVFTELVRWACLWPVLILLTALAGLGAGSRVVLGYLSPGEYAEEVVAARTFFATGRLYSTDARSEFAEWVSARENATVPWSVLPGVTPCQANALSNRERFYTEHAHSPMLLLGAAPVVALTDGKGLFVLLTVLAAASVGVMWTAASSLAGISLGSRQAWLVLVALVGWQPVLASLRQGDAVLLAAGLVALTWRIMRSQPRIVAALPCAIAAGLTPAAVGALAALLRRSVRTGVQAVGLYLLLMGTTFAMAGVQTLPDYLWAISDTARTYADAIPNYALAGRVLSTSGTAGLATVAVLVLLVSWYRARNVDAAFAAFAAAGLLCAPVVWSQHLALAFIPAVLLLRSVVSHGSPALLLLWAALMMLISLPDQAVIALTRAVDYLGPVIPLVPVALVAIWLWIPLPDRRAQVPASSESPSAALGALS